MKLALISKGKLAGFSGIACLLTNAMLYNTVCMGQGTAADYSRAELIKQKMENNIFYAPRIFRWLEKENRFWYLNQTPQGKEFILVDAQSKNRQPLFDQVKLAASLSATSGKTVAPYNLPFEIFSFLEGNKEIEFTWNEKFWRVDLQTYKCTEDAKSAIPPPVRMSENINSITEINRGPVKSPDKKWIAYIREYNVFIQSAANKKEEYQLSFDGSEGEYYSSNIEWSPDGTKLATNKVRANKPHTIYLIESSPEDQVQPKLHLRNYLKPGDALPQKQPCLFIVSTKKQIQVDPVLIGSQFNISNPVWRRDSRAFTFEYNKRGHQVYKVIEVNAASGNVRDLIDEEAETFIYSRKKFRYDVEDGKEIIWASERNGWNHLYLYDGATGKIKNAITSGHWVIRNVIKVDEAGRTIIFEASGREAGQDPYLIQLYTK